MGRLAGFLLCIWSAPLFAADTAVIYLQDSVSMRTIFADTVDVTPNGNSGYDLYMEDVNGVYDVTLDTRRGDRLAVRSYADAKPGGIGAQNPELEVSASGATCKIVNGTFQVLEFDATGPATKLSFDFIETCADGNTLSGAVRLNSDLPVNKPITVAPAPVDPPLPPSLLYINSPKGDVIGQGVITKLTDTDGTFSAQVFTDGGEVDYQDGNGNAWQFAFSSGTGAPFALGTFTGATLYPDNSTGPGIEVASNNSCDVVAGDFAVLEYSLSADHSTLESLAVDFDQSCDGGPPLKGSIRYFSAKPLPP